MPCQIHLIVQNSNDLDDVIACRPIQDEMPAAAALSGHMKCVHARQYFFTRGAACDVRPLFKRGEGFDQRDCVSFNIPFAERFLGVGKDADEIPLSVAAEAYSPAWSRHRLAVRPVI